MQIETYFEEEMAIPENGDPVLYHEKVTPLRITALLGKPYRFSQITVEGKTLMPTEWVDFAPENRLDLSSFLNYFYWVEGSKRWELIPEGVEK